MSSPFSGLVSDLKGNWYEKNAIPVEILVNSH